MSWKTWTNIPETIQVIEVKGGGLVSRVSEIDVLLEAAAIIDHWQPSSGTPNKTAEQLRVLAKHLDSR